MSGLEVGDIGLEQVNRIHDPVLFCTIFSTGICELLNCIAELRDRYITDFGNEVIITKSCSCYATFDGNAGKVCY